ncbi:glycosyltransferase family 4 protein [Cellulomonas hominis]
MTLTAPTLVAGLDRLSSAHRSALDERLGALRDVLPAGSASDPAPAAGATRGGTAVDAVVALLDPRDRAAVWLLVAVVSQRLPTDREVLAASRRGVLDGPAATLAAALELLDVTEPPVPLRIAVGETLVDVHNTAHTSFFTGIQRVARECARHWTARHDVTLIAWSSDLRCPVDLPAGPRAHLLGLDAPGTDGEDEGPATRVVPWRSTYLIPELAAERPRTDRLLAMARRTGTRVGSIGYDLVPLTSSETVIAHLPNEFAGHLAASRHYATVAAISEAAAQEYRGWRTMLSGAGYAGPEIVAVPLAAEVAVPTPEQQRAARDLLMIGDLPLVLCVGSHEPRKNHLAVLQAAEMLWRRGAQFALTFIGGNSWNSETFHRTVEQLQAANHPVVTLAGIDDATLWSAYRLARFTVFPSLNEGFGLPVAESLASGTPVVTSEFGSMREIAADGGALLVDPHDDRALAEAMSTLLSDDAELHRLTEEAGRRTVRTWDAYTADVWARLTA